jgi:ribonuclease HI
VQRRLIVQRTERSITEPGSARIAPARARGTAGVRAEHGHALRACPRLLHVYTDGAAEPNPGPGGYAAIIIDERGEHELVGYETHTTNNRMELMAAIVALEHLERGSVRVTSDSQYLVQGASRWRFAWKRRGWRLRDGGPVLNVDLWQRLDAAIQKHAIVEWLWQRGHAGHHYNERCDVLAAAACREGRRSQSRNAWAGARRAAHPARRASSRSVEDDRSECQHEASVYWSRRRP